MGSHPSEEVVDTAVYGERLMEQVYDYCDNHLALDLRETGKMVLVYPSERLIVDLEAGIMQLLARECMEKKRNVLSTKERISEAAAMLEEQSKQLRGDVDALGDTNPSLIAAIWQWLVRLCTRKKPVAVEDSNDMHGTTQQGRRYGTYTDNW